MDALQRQLDGGRDNKVHDAQAALAWQMARETSNDIVMSDSAHHLGRT